VTSQSKYTVVDCLSCARQRGVAELYDTCSDWLTVGLQLGKMSPTIVAGNKCWWRVWTGGYSELNVYQ